MKGQDLREQFGVNQWLDRKRVITSLDLAKRDEILPGLRQVHWGLVIVDEAHRMSAADESHKSFGFRSSTTFALEYRKRFSTTPSGRQRTSQ